MRDRQAAERELGEQRLNVAQHDFAGRGIAVVANRRAALEPVDDRGRAEVVADQAEAAVAVVLHAVEGHDTGRSLAAVLQRVEAESGVRGRIVMAEDAEDAALFVQLVVVEGVDKRRRCHSVPWISRSIALRSALV